MRAQRSPPSVGSAAAPVGTGQVVPRAVAKAIRFMRDNLATQVSADVLAKVAGTPERTLRRQFRRFTGHSPAAFHRSLRLEAASRTLRAATATDVTATASKHGFSHFGHFAAKYRQRFGELPSDTLRSGREPVMYPRSHVAHELVALAVLPFTSPDEAPGEAALADATTDGLISALGRMRWLDVLGLNVPPADQSDAPAHLAHAPRARYALRGRIRSLGGRVQMAVRLFEVTTGRHIWGNAFEGSTADAHALQARVIEGICGTLPICLRGAEAARAERKPARDRTAHDLTMRAFRGASALTQDANARALGDLDRALSIDPELCLAVALAAWCHAQRAIYNFAGSLEQERDEVRRLAAIALCLDDEDSRVLAVLGTASTLIGDLDLAELLIAKCLAIDPYCAMAWQRRGWIATYRSANTALADFNRCLALDPLGPDKLNSLLGLSTAHFLAGRYDQAADWAIRGLQERPSAIWPYRIAATAQARCGRTAEARRSTTVLLRQYPDLTAMTVINALPMQAEFLARCAEGLESAGLPV